MTYDDWLESDYQQFTSEGEAYLDWCSENDLDPADDANHTEWVDVIEAGREDYEVDVYLHNQEVREREGGW